MASGYAARAMAGGCRRVDALLTLSHATLSHTIVWFVICVRAPTRTKALLFNLVLKRSFFLVVVYKLVSSGFALLVE